ncbi:hypothetical protein H0I26_07130 [Olleya sp. HaHaR_3_96]|nr:hypothetical protein CW732_07300 [Olleya sp. Bg11-27]QXP61905.1 hypothetical protein H0I26_07130 [Olleya sp. HaHaR_3_96]
MISCEESGHICDKAQYHEASIWEKVKFKFHTLICKVCRQHSETNGKLTALIEKVKSKNLSSTEKDTIKSSFEKELNKHQH